MVFLLGDDRKCSVIAQGCFQIPPGQIPKKKTGLENDKMSFLQREAENN